MSQTPKFTTVTPSFHTELKNRINAYFQETGKTMSGNFKLWSKAIILVTICMALYIHLVFFDHIVWIALVECALLGCVVSAIGFNIMHDGSHGSFSNNPTLNKVAAVTLSILGGNHFMWNMKHNVIHHAYTNIDGVDDDIDAGILLRMASTQKKYKFHKYQHIYVWGLYCILYIYWIFGSDYKKYFKGRIGEIPLKKMSAADHIYFWMYKILHLTVFFIIPFIFVGILPTIVGFLTMTMVAGFVLSVVFQLAHTVEHTSMPMPDEETGKISDEWAIHQLKTTANFATSNRFISWYVGGLNFQVEHHLFPKISHIHYPAISKIVKQACKEYKVTYIEYPKMWQAFRSHIAYLKLMGSIA